MQYVLSEYYLSSHKTFKHRTRLILALIRSLSNLSVLCNYCIDNEYYTRDIRTREERCVIGGTSFRSSIIKLSSSTLVRAASRDVFLKQGILAVNDCIAQHEIIMAQTTRLARPDIRYTIVIQYYAPRTKND